MLCIEKFIPWEEFSNALPREEMRQIRRFHKIFFKTTMISRKIVVYELPEIVLFSIPI